MESPASVSLALDPAMGLAGFAMSSRVSEVGGLESDENEDESLEDEEEDESEEEEDESEEEEDESEDEEEDESEDEEEDEDEDEDDESLDDDEDEESLDSLSDDGRGTDTGSTGSGPEMVIRISPASHKVSPHHILFASTPSSLSLELSLESLASPISTSTLSFISSRIRPAPCGISPGGILRPCRLQGVCHSRLDTALHLEGLDGTCEAAPNEVGEDRPVELCGASDISRRRRP